jgi:hypothetical protein
MLSCGTNEPRSREAMTFDTHPLLEPNYSRLHQDNVVALFAGNCVNTTPAIKMIISAWYLDELGIPTRDIKATD